MARHWCYSCSINIRSAEDHCYSSSTPSPTKARLCLSTTGLLIYIGTEYSVRFYNAGNNMSDERKYRTKDKPYQNAYQKTKPMPPLSSLAKKLEPQSDRIQSGASRAEQKKAHGQQEADTAKCPSLGVTVEPASKQTDLGAPETRSEPVESLLQQHNEDVIKQEEEETTESPGLGVKIESGWKQADLEVPEIRSELVKSLLQQHERKMAEQGEEDKTENLNLGATVESASKKADVGVPGIHCEPVESVMQHGSI